MEYVLVLLVLTGTFMTSEQSVFEDMEPGTRLSRFDYDYEMLKKMLDLENQLAQLTKRFDKIEVRKGSDLKTECNDGWLAYKGSCYLFGPSLVNFNTAKEYCIMHDAYLVRVESAREDSFLRAFMDQHIIEDVDYWIGMNDDETEGVWKFTDDDTKVPYLGWHETEPQDAGTGEDCAAFGYHKQYKWIDVTCVSLRRPLCEKR